MSKLFTIVTVCYNSVETIEQTFKSLLQQAYDNYDYIVIDGGSTDGTLNIIKQYEDKFEGKMQWISEADNGIYDAMNKGINMSRGNVIGFLNSDDYYEKDTLYNVSEFLKVNKYADFIYGRTNLVYNFNSSMVIKLDNPVNKITHQTLNKGMGFIHQSSFVRRNVFEKIGNFNTNFKIGADWDFVIRCFNNNIKFQKIDAVLSNFSKNGISSKSHIFEKHKIRQLNQLYKIIDLYLLKDIISLASVVSLLLSDKHYLVLREFYHKYLHR